MLKCLGHQITQQVLGARALMRQNVLVTATLLEVALLMVLPEVGYNRVEAQAAMTVRAMRIARRSSWNPAEFISSFVILDVNERLDKDCPVYDVAEQNNL